MGWLSRGGLARGDVYGQPTIGGMLLRAPGPLDEPQVDLQFGGGVAHIRLEPGSNPACRHGAVAPPLRPESAHPELPWRPLADIHSYGTEDPGQAGPGCATGGNAPSWPWRAISSARSRGLADVQPLR